MTSPSGQPRPGEDLAEDPRLRARADLVWYLRHADALRRWPVLAEGWAQAVESHRLGDSGGSGGPPPGNPQSSASSS